jgi:hypothetical protein
MPASIFLRRALIADAAVSGATGLLMAAGATTLERLLAAPSSLLRVAGVALIPYALGLVVLSRRTRLAPAGVWTVIGLNFAWAVASVLLLASGWIQPSALGYAFILVQAFAVVGFADLQFVGLRKAAAAAA